MPHATVDHSNISDAGREEAEKYDEEERQQKRRRQQHKHTSAVVVDDGNSSVTVQQHEYHERCTTAAVAALLNSTPSTATATVPTPPALNIESNSGGEVGSSNDQNGHDRLRSTTNNTNCVSSNTEQQQRHAKERCVAATTTATAATVTIPANTKLTSTLETSYSFDLVPAPLPQSSSPLLPSNDYSDLSDIILCFDNNRFGRDNNTGQCKESSGSSIVVAASGRSQSNVTGCDAESDKPAQPQLQSILLKTESWKTVQNYSKDLLARNPNCGKSKLL